MLAQVYPASKWKSARNAQLLAYNECIFRCAAIALSAKDLLGNLCQDYARLSSHCSAQVVQKDSITGTLCHQQS